MLYYNIFYTVNKLILSILLVQSKTKKSRRQHYCHIQHKPVLDLQVTMINYDQEFIIINAPKTFKGLVIIQVFGKFLKWMILKNTKINKLTLKLINQ